MSFLSPWIRSAHIPIALRLPRLNMPAACLSTIPPSENASSTRTGAHQFLNVTATHRNFAVDRRIETLDPARLRSSDFVKLVRWTSVYRVKNTESDLSVYSRRIRMLYGSRNNVNCPFPPETHGFFYYWANPDVPTEGQIRFRVTQDKDPSSFFNGHDLLGMDGLPWCITLFQAFNFSKYDPLGELLVEENLITKDIAEQARSLRTRLDQTTTERLHVRQIRPVMKLGQVFALNLSRTRFVIWTDREDVTTKTRNLHPWSCNFTDPRTQRRRIYSAFDAGLIHVCFEQSPLPAHAGKRVLALRLVRIVEPIRLTEQSNRKIPMPPFEEGKFITRVTNQLWTIDCEGSGQRAIAFRRLFDGQMPDGGAVAEDGQS